MLEIITQTAADVSLGIVCNILTDCVYEGFKTVKNLKNNNNKMREKINQIMTDFVSSYSGTVVESGTFLNFLQLPQISDLMTNYVQYIGIGKLQKGEMNLTTKEQLLNYLTDSAYKQFDCQITIPQKGDILHFFEGFVECCHDFYYANLNVSEKSMLFFVGEKLKNLEEMIRNSLMCEIEDRQNHIEEVGRKYTELLKKNHQSVFVYGFRELKMDTFYIPPKLMKVSEAAIPMGIGNVSLMNGMLRVISSKKPYSYNDVFKNQNMVYVIGGPGYGKSVLLNYFIINYEKMNILHNKGYIVIYCDLKSYFHYSKEKAFPMDDFFVESMIEETGLSRNLLNEEFLHYYLKTGRCLFLLDALDEVPGQNRNKLHKKITSYLLSYNPNNKICITSRSRGFIPDFDIEVYEILPLDKKQIDEYLERMIKLKYFNKENKDLFLQQADVLIEKEFLNSFLILSLLVNIFRAEKKLPSTKVDLYGKCFSYVSRDRELEKTSEYKLNDWNQVSKIMKDSTFIELAKLACPNNKSISEDVIVDKLTVLYTKSFGTADRAEEVVREFLKFCSERTELFVPSASEREYKFFHRSFFEYFYAKYISRMKQVKEIIKEMKKFGLDSEVQELTVAMIKNEDGESKYDFLLYEKRKACSSEILAMRNERLKKYILLVSGLRKIKNSEHDK